MMTKDHTPPAQMPRAVRTRAQEFPALEPSFDTAPAAAFDRPDPVEWGTTAVEAREMLARQTCPVCREGPWKSPLNHIARKHGIDGMTMRDVCGLTTIESVTDPELSARFAERGREIDMSAVNHKGKPRRRQRWTSAGRQKVAANLDAIHQSPEAAGRALAALAQAHTVEARKRQGASLKARWDSMSDDERSRATAHLRRSPQELSAQAEKAWDERGRKPHGTRASYRRGCRCDQCRAAYLAYRKAHG